LTLSGTVVALAEGIVTLAVVGRNSLGDHITSTVTLSMGVRQ